MSRIIWKSTGNFHLITSRLIKAVRKEKKCIFYFRLVQKKKLKVLNFDCSCLIFLQEKFFLIVPLLHKLKKKEEKISDM
jgi:hypothetical protein